MTAMARLRGGDSQEFGRREFGQKDLGQQDFGQNPGRREARTRRVARSPRHHWVSIGTSGSAMGQAVIRDLSSHGCRIDTDATWLRIGAFITIRLDEQSAVMGIVRWLRGGAGGIEFLQPIRPGDDAWQVLFDDH